MRHGFFDRHSHLDSLLHRLDPRTKLLFFLALIVAMVACQRPAHFGFFFLILLALMVLSRVPLIHFLGRLLRITPLVAVFAFFYLLPALFDGLGFAPGIARSPQLTSVLLLATKTYGAVLALTLLTSTTPFNDLLWGLRRFRLPRSVTTLCKLVYTYLFVLVDELQRMTIAIRSRAPQLRVARCRFFGQWLGSLFLRSLNRSETLYQAMVSRGFDGEFPEGGGHHPRAIDVLFLSALAGVLILMAIHPVPWPA